MNEVLGEQPPSSIPGLTPEQVQQLQHRIQQAQQRRQQHP